jgi:hypothetical protein
MIDKDTKLEYDIVKLDDKTSCENPECDKRRKYGIKTKVCNNISLLGFYIGLKSRVKTKVHCPDHRPEHRLSTKAKKKEHEKARELYRNKKYKQQREQYGKIISSGYLPTFEFKIPNKLTMKNNPKFETNDIEFSEAVEFIRSFDIKDPVLLSRSDKYLFCLIKPDGTVEKKEASHDSDINYSEFKERYQDYNYRMRDYNSIRTRDFTSAKYQNRSIKDINREFDNFDIIEWREYNEIQGHLDFRGLDCPSCGKSSHFDRYFLSRVLDNNIEKICISHERCGRIMGVLNPNLINEDAYNIGLANTKN